MGLGKTVMTISLILARPGKGINEDENEGLNKKIDYETKVFKRPRGGTLIVCPMALLSQWKVCLLQFVKIKKMHFFLFFLSTYNLIFLFFPIVG